MRALILGLIFTVIAWADDAVVDLPNGVDLEVKDAAVMARLPESIAIQEGKIIVNDLPDLDKNQCYLEVGSEKIEWKPGTVIHFTDARAHDGYFLMRASNPKIGIYCQHKGSSKLTVGDLNQIFNETASFTVASANQLPVKVGDRVEFKVLDANLVNKFFASFDESSEDKDLCFAMVPLDALPKELKAGDVLQFTAKSAGDTRLTMGTDDPAFALGCYLVEGRTPLTVDDLNRVFAGMGRFTRAKDAAANVLRGMDFEVKNAAIMQKIFRPSDFSVMQEGALVPRLGVPSKTRCFFVKSRPMDLQWKSGDVIHFTKVREGDLDLAMSTSDRNIVLLCSRPTDTPQLTIEDLNRIFGEAGQFKPVE